MKLGMAPALLEYALDLLPLRQYPERAYRTTMAEAGRRIGRRDPDDVDVLALALRLEVPLWSNDRDFEGTGIKRLTTTDLLKVFFRPSTGSR
jgi:predicted nucleic acid-binding protein